MTNIQRIWTRFFEDCHNFSPFVAIGRIIRDASFITWNNRKKMYEKVIINYLNRKVGKILREERQEDINQADYMHYIWTMWWQNEQDMPDIVKACYDRLKVLYNDHIIMITRDNYLSWVDLPNYIIEKFEKGYISITHLSDIIRVALLKKYGGLWLDLTIYVKTIPSIIYSYDIYTLHAPGLFPDFISKGEWSTFFLYSKYLNAPLFNLLYDAYCEYWKKHNTIIDYLLFDFLIRLVLDYHPDIYDKINSIKENRHFYDLNLMINSEYNYESAKSIMIKSPVQKLTYKKKMCLFDENGNETNYSRIITGRFDFE